MKKNEKKMKNSIKNCTKKSNFIFYFIFLLDPKNDIKSYWSIKWAKIQQSKWIMIAKFIGVRRNMSSWLKSYRVISVNINLMNRFLVHCKELCAYKLVIVKILFHQFYIVWIFNFFYSWSKPQEILWAENFMNTNLTILRENKLFCSR